MTTKRKEGDEQLRCGSCGGEQVRIFGTRSRGIDAYDSFAVECVKCDTYTVLRPIVSIELDWGGASPGKLCGGWSKSRTSPRSRRRRVKK